MNTLNCLMRALVPLGEKSSENVPEMVLPYRHLLEIYTYYFLLLKTFGNKIQLLWSIATCCTQFIYGCKAI